MSTPTEIVTVKITNRAADQINRGILWIYSNEVVDKKSVREPGQWCWFESQHGVVVGTGYFNPHSLISGRVVSSQKETNLQALLAARLKASLGRRNSVDLKESARLVFSEADLLPGLVVDWLSGALIIQSNTAGVDQQLTFITETLTELLIGLGTEVKAVVWRQDSSIRTMEGVPQSSSIQKGSESELRKWFFSEAGTFYCADILDGQKTGFFLDQRENRDFLASWISKSKNASVLDLFCYSGGWGFRALAAGASRVYFVDQSESALRLVKEGADKNKFAASSCVTTASDAFDFLSQSGEMFDVVVADPPAFVKSKKNLPQARKAYEKLARLSWRRVKPGGLLLFSSCSFHLSEFDFMDLLRDSIGREEGLAHVVYRGGQGSDHPVLLSMPETKYLKCMGLQKL